MAYLIDRQRVLAGREIVAIVSVRQRRIRSRVILWDNSWYQTLTRPGTFRRYSARRAAAILQIGARKRKGAIWWTRQ